MKHSRPLLLALCSTLSAPGLIHAAELNLTPALCAIDEGEEHCAISVNVAFSGDENKRYCLTISGKGLVRCFDSQPLNEMQVYVTADTNTQFLVTEKASGKEVATATLKVARYRPTRHQRRYGWGLL